MARPTAIFPKEKSVGPREWGEEILLVLSSGKYTMKKLIIKSGNKGGLQFHRKKDEAGYIVSGTMKIRFEDKNGKIEERLVSEGDWFHFPTGSVHQEEAITDCLLVEVSTPYANDRVRVENDFNILDESGLPSTELKDIKEL